MAHAKATKLIKTMKKGETHRRKKSVPVAIIRDAVELSIIIICAHQQLKQSSASGERK
jgi:hypothetical protein